MLKGARFCHHCGWDQSLPASRWRGASPRRRYQRWVMGAILSSLLVTVLYVLLIPNNGAQAAVITGQPAPDFALQDLAGETVRLSDLRGQVVVLNFWATWCPPCRAEMPDLEAAYQTYREQGMVVLAVNLQESPATVRAFQQRLGISFPIVLDRDGRVTQQYNIIPLPTTFFIDRDGVVQGKWEGQLTPQVIENQVGRLLSP